MFRLLHTRGTARLGALMLLLVLLPGWTMPPECAACPHGSDAEATEQVVAETGSHGGAESHSGAQSHAEVVAPASTHEAPDEGKAAEHHEDDCGCPCDVQCTSAQVVPPATSESRSMDGADAPTFSMVPTRHRPAAPPFPAHFLPLSNAPPR